MQYRTCNHLQLSFLLVLKKRFNAVRNDVVRSVFVHVVKINRCLQHKLPCFPAHIVDKFKCQEQS